ncbi:MAG: hypothetical protein AAF565_10500, partial [Pseudomonadota bacterium]
MSASAHDANRDDFDVEVWATAELVREGETTFDPLFAVCAPSSNAIDNLQVGQQLLLQKSVDGVWNVGDYGVLDSLSDDEAGTCANAADNASRTACLLGLNERETPSAIEGEDIGFFGDSTNQDTGQQNLSFHSGINVRFGSYDELVAEFVGSDAISPDLNTFAGEQLSCSGSAYGVVAEAHGLPHHECFDDASCSFSSPVLDQLALNTYCALAYDGYDDRDFDDACYQEFGQDIEINTLFDIYQLEVAAITSEEGLTFRGGDTINSCNAANATLDRRIAEVAFVDCSGLNGTSQSDIAPLGFGTVFFTSPADDSDYFVATFEVDTDGNRLYRGDVPSSAEHWMDEGFDQVEKDNSGNFVELDGNANPLTDPYAAFGLTIDTIPHWDDDGDQDFNQNAPMVFDTRNPTGGDDDLAATGRGNILIISEDGDQSDPDDEVNGGTIVFRFDEPTFVHSIIVFDTEEGGTLRTFTEALSDQELADLNLYGRNCNNTSNSKRRERCHNRTGDDFVDDFDAKIDNGVVIYRDENGDAMKINKNGSTSSGGEDQLAGEHNSWAKGVAELGDNEYVREMIAQTEVRVLTYTLHRSNGVGDSGAIDDLIFFNGKTEPNLRDSLFVEYLGESPGASSLTLAYPQITN